MLVQLSSVCARIEILANGQPNSLIQPPSGDAPFDEYLKTLEILVSRVEVSFFLSLSLFFLFFFFLNFEI